MEGDILQFAQVMMVIVASTAGFVTVGLGGRILWRLGSRQRPLVRGSQDDAHMQRLEMALDTVAIEVERISESQRFMVGLLSDSLPTRRGERVAELGTPESISRVKTPV